MGAKHEGDPLSGRNHILASLCPQVSGWVGQWVGGCVLGAKHEGDPLSGSRLVGDWMVSGCVVGAKHVGDPLRGTTT